MTLYREDSTIDYCLILNILLISMTAIGLFKYKLHCELCWAAEADSDNSNMAAKTSTRLDIRASNEGPHEGSEKAPYHKGRAALRHYANQPACPFVSASQFHIY